MKVANVVHHRRGWMRFHLSIGGFVIKNCRWHVPTGRVFFPRRYDMGRKRHQVVFAYGAHVKRLRGLLLSGETQTPRDRRPCTLKIDGFRRSIEGDGHPQRDRWLIFDFTVRGFKILGCRWQPESRSIQLPVTFYADEDRRKWRKKAVVCAYGSHINRLRASLEAEVDARTGRVEPQFAEVSAP